MSVDILQVGQKQLWDWCGWNNKARPYAGNAWNTIRFDELRGGLGMGHYAIVCGSVRFACNIHVEIVATVSSLIRALRLVNMYLAYEERCYGMEHRYVREFEIWHIVDDAELWQEWECLSAQYVFENQLGCNVPNEYVTEEAYAAMGRVVRGRGGSYN